jgi:1-acyl-sn-glycerol-3-phosphate acyltransferase
MNAVLETLLGTAPVVGLTAALSPVVFGASLRDPQQADRLIRWYTQRCLAIARVRAEVRGLEHVPGGPCVLVANHQSHYDALMIVAHVPKTIRFIAKAELFRIPLFGQALRATGNVEVSRSGSTTDRESVARAVLALRGGTSILFFAEGTRSEAGELGAFKKGAAVLAIQAQVPLLPLAVAGTGNVLPKGSARVRRGCRAALVVGPPLSTAGLTLDARDALTQQCHTTVAGLLREAEALIQEAR